MRLDVCADFCCSPNWYCVLRSLTRAGILAHRGHDRPEREPCGNDKLIGAPPGDDYLCSGQLINGEPGP